MSKLDDLSPKRRRFVEEYPKDLNATQAAIRAGYSAKTARQQASQLLSKLNIQEAIAELVEERSQRCKVSADQVVGELVKMGFVNMMDYMRIGENGDPYVDLSALTRDQAASIVEFTCEDYKDGRGEDARDVRKIKIKLYPKIPALVELGKHLGLFKGGAAGGTPNATEHPPDLLAKDDPSRVDVIERFAKAAEKWAKPASQTGKAT